MHSIRPRLSLLYSCHTRSQVTVAGGLSVCAPTHHKTLAKMVTFRPIFGRKRSQKGAKLCGQLTSKTWHPNLVKTASHIKT